MVVHLDVNDERYPDAAERILRRHDRNEAEANITSAIRDFLVDTNLAKRDDIKEEKAPALGARTAVDLTALDTFVEIKRRIGTTPGFDPDPDNVEQLDGYLEQSEKEGGRHRMGVLTDGKALAAPLARRGARSIRPTHTPSPWRVATGGCRSTSGCATRHWNRGTTSRWTGRARESISAPTALATARTLPA